MVANPDRRVSELQLMSQAEQQKVLVTWNDTASEYPRDECIHRVVSQQARRSPAALAVSGNGKQLNYSDLERRSDQLARKLRSLGIGQEVLVGICMERSPEMIIALLGVLKAGGAYVPMDQVIRANGSHSS